MPRCSGYRVFAVVVAVLFLWPPVPCCAREILLDAKTQLLSIGIISIEAYGRPKAAAKISDALVRTSAVAYLDALSTPASAVVVCQQSTDPSRSDFAFLVAREAVITDGQGESSGATAVHYRSKPADRASQAYLPQRYFMPKEDAVYPFSSALLEMVGLGPGIPTVTNSTPYCVQYAGGDGFRVAFLSRSEFSELAGILEGFDLSNFEAAGRRRPEWLIGLVVVVGICVTLLVRKARRQTDGDVATGETVAAADDGSA